MGKNILYIIGAGGSAEFLQDHNNAFLTTKILTDSLADKESWVKTLSLIKRSCNSSFRDFDLSIDDFWAIQKIFNANFDAAYENNQRLSKITNNFETQIAYLDFIVEYCKNVKSPRIAKFHPANHCKVQFGDKSCEKLCDCAELRMLPVWAREVIHQRINDFAIKDEAINILTAYFAKELDENSSVNIYSLNYDTLLVSALRNLSFLTGFDDKGVFDKVNFLNARHAIAFLHGHQNFYASTNAIQMASDFDTAFGLRAKAFWTNDHQTITQKIKSPSFVTGINKEKELQVDVYRFYYAKFINDALKADEVCCIGYGCQDDHVNSIIRLFFDLKRQVTFVGNTGNYSGREYLSRFANGFLNKGNLSIDLSKVRIWRKGAKSFFENNSVDGWAKIK
ncbi:MAG: hypothetical protein WC530_07465 [Candidatus Omnitrophota bacterium]|jgi:hypothetical protein